ncbi:MAG TPA: hypothetical protein VEH48_00480 [Candidatus Nitrosopolaris sp.]|nr:hypothetical protein [Candidatus Nitrosopolaris sp.]
MARKSRTFKLTRKAGLISAAALVVVIASSLGAWHYHDRTNQETLPVAPATNTTYNQTNSNNQSVGSSDKQAAPAGGYSATTTSNSPSNNTGQPPLTPSPPFVSNHKPGLNGTPTTENSVCNTTPGASCYIEFTMGNKTIKLQAGTADTNGSVYWENWDVNNPSYGFSSGSWTITAVATLNGQTQTATDSQNLVIQ